MERPQTGKQHFVPQFLLRNFATNDGRLFCFNISTNAVTKSPPKNICFETDIYPTFIRKGQSAEAEFALIESRASTAIRNIIKSRSLKKFSASDKDSISKFISCQSIRTSAFRDGLHGNHIEYEEFIANHLELIAIHAMHVASRGWVLLETKLEDPFYIGDNPVTLQRTERPNDGSVLGIDIPGVEIFLPINPTLSLYLPCPQTSKTLIHGYEEANAIIRGSRYTEASQSPEVIEASLRVLSSAYGIYQALQHGAALAASPDNVKNFNALQCSWAQNLVFSHSNDFSFARHVFSNTPSYKGIPQTSMIQIGTVILPEES